MNTQQRKKKIVVVSNMYPDEGHPSSGIFVKKFVDLVCSAGRDCELCVMTSADTKLSKAFKYFAFYMNTFFATVRRSSDIVYVHYPSYSAAPVLLARKLRKFPLYVNVHGSDVLPINHRQERMHRFTRAAIAQAEKVIVPSEYFADVVCEKYMLDGKKVTVSPSGGVDLQTFHPLGSIELEAVKSDFGLHGDAVTLCFAGRITEGKGWDTYLYAVRELIESGMRLNALLVGSGDQDTECARLIDELGLAGLILRLGLQPQSELCRLYNAADLFVFPGSRSESLGLVAIEAMACGTPVIASDFAAPKYYIRDGENGYKIPVGDWRALANAVRSVRIDSLEYQYLREGALKTADRYSSLSVARGLEEILED